jgi:hypothetical protein
VYNPCDFSNATSFDEDRASFAKESEPHVADRLKRAGKNDAGYDRESERARLEHRIKKTGAYIAFPKSIYDSLLALPTVALLKTAMMVARWTIGFHSRDSARISATAIAGRTGLKRDTVIHALRELHHEGVLIKVAAATGRRPAEWRINPDLARWGRFGASAEGAAGCDQHHTQSGVPWDEHPTQGGTGVRPYDPLTVTHDHPSEELLETHSLNAPAAASHDEAAAGAPRCCICKRALTPEEQLSPGVLYREDRGMFHVACAEAVVARRAL